MEENGGGDESSIRHNTKYEDLLRQQLQHKDSLDASLESELVVSQKSDPSASGSGSKRLTPVGDIDKEPYQDGYSSLPVGGSTGFDPGQSGRGSGRLSSQNLYSGSASDLRQDYELDRHSVKSGNLGSSHHSIGDAALGDDVGSPKSPSRAGSDFSGSLGSGRPTSQRELFENASGSRPGSGGHISLDKRIDDVWGGSSSHASSVRLTPTRETIGDVLGKDALPSATSTARSHSSGSARQTPERDLGLIGPTAQTSARDSISSAVRGSHERLFGSQELLTTSDQRLLPGSRPLSQSGSRPGSSTGSHPGGVTGSLPGSILGSRAGSQHGSRAQSLASLTSEQELSQFLDNSNSQSGSEPRRTPLNFDTHPDESAALPPIMRSDRDRPSSLPAYSSQSAAGLESKRTFTPDNQTWSPLASGGLGEAGFQRDMLSRIAPKSSVSSRASSRTVTPVSAAGDREDSAKVRDLEETVATLRKLLSSREQEVHELTAKLRDLKDINQSLKKDLDHARARRTPSGPEEMERQYEQLLQEKEILAAEVVKLRDRLEANRGSGVDSFSSSSATSMQKRIDELEAHIRDLRHSSDSTSQKLLRAEMRVKDLTDENDRLRSSSSLRVQDLQDDRSGLHGDRRLQIEIQQLREDVRTMRDRNYSLQEENLKLKEGREPSRSSDLRSRDMLRDLTGRNPVSSSVRSDDGVHHRPAVDSSLRDSGSLQATEHGRSKHLPLHDQLASPRRLGSHRQLDRSYGSDNFPSVSSRDPHQRLHDRSFGSDQGAREGGRDTGSYSLSALENGDKEPSSDRLGKYRELVDRGTDLRRTDPGRYDVLRSRPDGEVSEKLRATDAGKYGTLSAEKLRSFDRERESRDNKVTMSAERLRILEEAERNRERRAMASTNSAGRRPVSADNPVSSKDDGRRKKSEANLSDDSDSTSILMSYDAKVDPYSGHEREKSSYNERSRPHDTYYDRSYVHEKEQEKHRDREYRDLRVGYKETNGDDSDTATDILLNAEPGRTSSSSPRRRHQRTSIGDDASVSSLSDGDDAQDNRHRRSKSVDGKGKKGSSRYGQTTTLRPSASTEMLGSGSKTVTLSSGFRTVTPQPLATQHNKNAILQQQQQQQREASLSNSFTQGLRPFAPRSPGDVRPNDVVKFSRQGGKLSQGTVKFVGHLPGRSDVYLGVELYKEEGKHDGKFESIRYFKCKPNKGVFVAFNKVVMAWAPN